MLIYIRRALAAIVSICNLRAFLYKNYSEIFRPTEQPRINIRPLPPRKHNTSLLQRSFC